MDIPSISELEDLDAKHDLTTDELLQIASSLSPLLEIVKAARALLSDPSQPANRFAVAANMPSGMLMGMLYQRLVTSLGKVRP